MTLFYIILGIASGLFILGGSGFLIIRHYYRIYDAEESLKEDILNIILQLLKPF